MTIEDIISKYNSLKIDLGHPPSSTQFYRSSGVSNRTLGKFFPRESWSEFVKLCGDNPKKFSRPKSDFEEILRNYGFLVRQLKRLPVANEWSKAGFRPSVSGIEQSHGIKWSEIANKFYQFGCNKDEWIDIIPLFQIKIEENRIKTSNSVECSVYLMLDTKTRLYKIGISNKAEFREKTLQSEKPTITLIAAKKFINRRIAATFEKALHDSYSHKRKRGEWFILDEDEIHEIKTTLSN